MFLAKGAPPEPFGWAEAGAAIGFVGAGILVAVLLSVGQWLVYGRRCHGFVPRLRIFKRVP
jgi:hypothetical protein